RAAGGAPRRDAWNTITWMVSREPTCTQWTQSACSAVAQRACRRAVVRSHLHGAGAQGERAGTGLRSTEDGTTVGPGRSSPRGKSSTLAFLGVIPCARARRAHEHLPEATV